MSEPEGGLSLWVVYWNPSDFPGRFVVRRQVAVAPNPSIPDGIWCDPDPLAVVDTLDEARAAVPGWLTCLPRSPDDHPVVVEVWV